MEIEHEASRTLVKSPPELWAELSDVESLARHLGEFKAVRITRLEPETVVAWEGELASGTVRLEPSGWGTKVILTAQLSGLPDASTPGRAADAEPAVAEPETAPEPPPPAASPPSGTAPEPLPPPAPPPSGTAAPPSPPQVAPDPPAAPARRGLLGRLLALLRPEPPAPPPPPPAPVVQRATPPPPAREPEPAKPAPAAPALDAEAILTATLDRLGQAHHRPFSRA